MTEHSNAQTEAYAALLPGALRRLSELEPALRDKIAGQIAELIAAHSPETRPKNNEQTFAGFLLEICEGKADIEDEPLDPSERALLEAFANED